MTALLHGAMPFRRTFFPRLALIAAAFAGCQPPNSPQETGPRPVRTLVVIAGEAERVRTFPGKVEATKRAELAFQVSGLLVDLPVTEGQRVAKGQLIGQIRKDEFEARLHALKGQLDGARAALRSLMAGERPEERMRRESVVRAAEAKLANARADYDRNERLVRTKAVSRADFESAQTSYRVAQEELQAARQLLEKSTVGREESIDAQAAEVRGLEARVVEAELQVRDTTLLAPFDGVIAERYVEANQNVRAKQPIVKFQDVDLLDIAVDVPETVMSSLRASDIVRLEAEFSGAPGVRFPVELREVAQRADPVTQTFAVRMSMAAPDSVTLLPGMSANVTLTYRRANVLGGSRVRVPVNAVGTLPDGKPVVWVMGSDGTVASRPVQLAGPAVGGAIEVESGVEAGERIVTAGLRFLRDGLKVRDLGDALGEARP